MSHYDLYAIGNALVDTDTKLAMPSLVPWAWKSAT